ncbi:hypothetical protein FOZ61_000301 [Perkinsus olseni]|uniref:EF-hand domain-containing protein n=1 Tax=Perkinsus olseni TaxID=32597 RepID=A0A7J6M0G6_PEROL|nr:hypothetical protein FOZ61_000301 [Perkinsus olseni]
MNNRDHLDTPPDNGAVGKPGVPQGYAPKPVLKHTGTIKRTMSLEELFKAYDEDDSGCLDIKELGHLLRSIGYSLPQRCIEEHVLPQVTSGEGSNAVRVEQLSRVIELVKEVSKRRDAPPDGLTVGSEQEENLASAAQQLYHALREVSINLNGEKSLWGRPIEELVDERIATWDPRTCRGTRKAPAPKQREIAHERAKLYALAKYTLEMIGREIDMGQAMYNSLRGDLNQSHSTFKRAANRGRQIFEGFAQENFALVSVRDTLEAEVQSLEKVYRDTKAKHEAEQAEYRQEKKRHERFIERCAERKRASEARGDLLAETAVELVVMSGYLRLKSGTYEWPSILNSYGMEKFNFNLTASFS